MDMRPGLTEATRLLRLAACVSILLAGCGCGGGGEPATAPQPAVIDGDGGSVAASGAKLIVPQGALGAAVTIRIANDATGAPPLPAWAQAVGDMVAITPHNTTFAQPVTVRLPAPAVHLQPEQRLMIAKAEPGGSWEVLGNTVHADGMLEAQVRALSVFTAVIVTSLPPPIPVPTPEPFAITAVRLECNGVPCASNEILRDMEMTAIVENNGGQLPAQCTAPQIVIKRNGSATLEATLDARPGIFAVAHYRFTTASPVFAPLVHSAYYYVMPALRCTDAATNVASYQAWLGSADIDFIGIAQQEPETAVVHFPSAISLAVGEPLTIRSVLTSGGRLSSTGSLTYDPLWTADPTMVFLERLYPGDSYWRGIQTLNKTQADPRPVAGNLTAWMYWGFEHRLPSVTESDNGAQYRLRACFSRSGASVCAVGPTLHVTVLQSTLPPSFTRQPSSLQVTAGQTASLSASVAGLPVPALQWQTRPAGTNGAWTDVSGAIEASYTTPALALADSGTQFRIVASNAAGRAESAPVTVSVSAAGIAPTLSTQPASLHVITGSDAVFAIQAQGTAALSYHWRRNGEAIPGANAPILRLPTVAADDAGAYSVEVRNQAGSVLSDAATLRVSDGGATGVAPSIVTQPVSVLVNAGNTATFAVGAAGSGPLSFQWQRNGVPLAGATAAFHSIAAASAADQGSYRVEVRNALGSVLSFTVTLTVLPTAQPVAPTISTQPSAQIALRGSGAVFAVAASGSGPLTYQWTRDGAPIPGATAAVLMLHNVQAADAGLYAVTVGNALASVSSQGADLVVVDAPLIIAQPVPAQAVVGGTASFEVLVGGNGIRTQWLRNGVAIPGADEQRYTTPPLSAADNGAVYSAIVYNGSGIVFTQGALLTVGAPQPAALLVSAVAAGFANSLVVATDGSAWAWGYGVDPATGGYAANPPFATRPVPVQGLTDVTAVTLSSEAGSSYALHRDGTVSAWGRNEAGQLGDRSTLTRPLPVKVLQGANLPMDEVCAIAASDSVLVMARATGCSPGVNRSGITGAWVAGLFSRTLAGGASSVQTPLNGAVAQPVPGLPAGVAVVELSTTMTAATRGALSLRLIDDRRFAWGFNDSNRLGAGVSSVFAGGVAGPVEVSGFWAGRCCQAIGRDFALGIDGATGTAWAVGANVNGELGNGVGGAHFSPPVPVLVSDTVSAVAAGATHAAAISNGQLWTWGLIGTSVVRTPVRLGTTTGYSALAVGDVHALAIGPGGELHAWGDASHGALGDGRTSGRRSVPAVVMRP
ncbi:RCC1 domain-containing protein, alpha-tubulin suppressor [Burkholderiales bacterium JOSHI_001]|nr:RCC1 domain-containing protein, alpha-tubulin suppressor [Burkholderiales bacterium JOSHI_001]